MNELIHYYDMLIMILSFFIFLIISSYSYFQNRKAIINISFALMSLFVSFFTLGIFVRHITADPNWMLILYRLVHSCGAIAITFEFYFTLVYPKNQDIPWPTKILLFLPASIFVYLSLFTSLMIRAFQAIPARYLYLGKPIWGGAHIFYDFYSFLFMFGAVAVIGYKWLRAEGVDKVKLSIVGVAFLISGLAGNLFTLWLPRFGITRFDALGPLGLLIGILLIAYSIVRYKLFVITPGVAAQEILDALAGTMLVSDLNGKLLYQSGLHQLAETEIVKINEAVIAHGAVTDFRTSVGQVPYNVSAILFSQAGLITIVFHEITEMEWEQDKERAAFEKLQQRLLREKKVGEILFGLASTLEAKEIDKILISAREIFWNDPETLGALETMAQLVAERGCLLAQLQADKAASENKLSEIEKINREGVQRELGIIELRDKIRAIKERKEKT